MSGGILIELVLLFQISPFRNPPVKSYVLDLVRPFLNLVRPCLFTWLIHMLLLHFLLALGAPASQPLLSLLSYSTCHLMVV
jgi:hypothetical protein